MVIAGIGPASALRQERHVYSRHWRWHPPSVRRAMFIGRHRGWHPPYVRRAMSIRVREEIIELPPSPRTHRPLIGARRPQSPH